MANTITVTNLTQGPGDLYSGAVGAVEPADTSINISPAASAWNGLGGTSGGVKLTIVQTYDELDVDQIVDIPGRRKTKREYNIDTSLAEPTLENFQLALNETPPVTGSNWKSVTPTNDNSASQPNYIALIFDGYAPGSFRRRVIGRRMLSTNNATLEYGKKNQTLIPVTFGAHFVSSVITPFKIVDQTS